MIEGRLEIGFVKLHPNLSGTNELNHFNSQMVNVVSVFISFVSGETCSMVLQSDMVKKARLIIGNGYFDML